MLDDCNCPPWIMALGSCHLLHTRRVYSHSSCRAIITVLIRVIRGKEWWADSKELIIFLCLQTELLDFISSGKWWSICFSLSGEPREPIDTIRSTKRCMIPIWYTMAWSRLKPLKWVLVAHMYSTFFLQPKLPHDRCTQHGWYLSRAFTFTNVHLFSPPQFLQVLQYWSMGIPRWW